MKNLKRNEEGVSPVIATILMVAITVVLAATLYVMVSDIGGDSDTTEALGGSMDDKSDGWLININKGSVDWDANDIELYNTSSGASETGSEGDAPGVHTNLTFTFDGEAMYIHFNDNNDNDQLDGGDSFRIYLSGDASPSDYANWQFRISGTSLQMDLN